MKQRTKQQPLTPKELRVLEFIRRHMESKGCAPSYREIGRKFDYASLNSVQQYLGQLEMKGYLTLAGHSKKRAIELIPSPEEKGFPVLPILGLVAAGRPIEAIENREEIEVPPSFLKSGGEYFALKVTGYSMIDEGILPGDVVVVRRQPHAENGQIVVALINNEATIKKFQKRDSHIELIAANPSFLPISVGEDDDFKIEGLFTGLIRRI